MFSRSRMYKSLYKSVDITHVRSNKRFLHNTVLSPSPSTFTHAYLEAIKHMQFYMYNGTPGDAIAIITACPNLETLECHGTWPMSTIPSSIQRLTTEIPRSTITALHSSALTHLELENDTREWLTAEDVYRSFPNLTHVSLDVHDDEALPNRLPFGLNTSRPFLRGTNFVLVLQIQAPTQEDLHLRGLVELVLRGEPDARVIAEIYDPSPELVDSAGNSFIWTYMHQSRRSLARRNTTEFWEQADQIVQRRATGGLQGLSKPPFASHS